MATATKPPSPTSRGRIGEELRVSTYDSVSSLLVSLILMVGFFVSLMFLIWLTTVVRFAKPAVAVEIVEEYAGRGEHAEGYERDLEEPGMEELEEEPQLEETLEAVTDVVSTVSASLEALSTDSNISGKGKGLGDSRAKGPGGEGDDIIPRWERWQIRYASDSLAKYAKQLDYFSIELGAAGGGIAELDYASRFSGGGVKRRKGTSKAEQRLYFTWSSGKLREMDRQLLSKAGIPVQRRVLLQFYPKNTENLLAQAEYAYFQAKGKTVKDVRRTVFDVRQTGNNYEFVVMEQVYRW